MAELPLAGLNVVVTRPREQALDLVRRIEELGGKPLLLPLLQIEAVPDDSELHDQVTRMQQADLAIFISPNAVRYGMVAISASGGLPASVKVATVGPGSAKALHEHGITHVLTPNSRFDSEGLLALPELKNVSGRRVMIFRGDGGRELLGDTLKARGALVEYVTCYVRSKKEIDIAELLRQNPHVITVTSSEALSHLWESIKRSSGQGLEDLPIFLTQERIAALARQQGWRNVMVSEAGDDGLLTSLVAWTHIKRN